jgi:iron complex transport system ATP-binding protein
MDEGGGSMIELVNVSLKRKNRLILSGINWTVKDGEHWVLYGRNGAGKTLLLEIICGYLFPTEGEVVRFGKQHGEYDIRELRKRIGYVSTFLKGMFSGRERVIDVVTSGLFASVGLWCEAESADRVAARSLLASIGMEHRESDRFGELSDGEQGKALILRALINNPCLLLLDEPSKGLVFGSREDLLIALETLSKRQSTSIVLVTHHTEEITPLFGRIMVLHEGRSLFSGGIADCVERGVFRKVFDNRVRVVEFEGRYHTVLSKKEYASENRTG